MIPRFPPHKNILRCHKQPVSQGPPPARAAHLHVPGMYIQSSSSGVRLTRNPWGCLQLKGRENTAGNRSSYQLIVRTYPSGKNEEHEEKKTRKPKKNEKRSHRASSPGKLPTPTSPNRVYSSFLTFRAFRRTPAPLAAAQAPHPRGKGLRSRSDAWRPARRQRQPRASPTTEARRTAPRHRTRGRREL